MSTRQLQQMRARLTALRDQRNRIVHRSPELDRRSSAAVADARRRLEEVRAELAVADAVAAAARVEVTSFDRGRPVPGDEADWQAALRSASIRRDEAAQRAVTLQAAVADAQARLQRAVADQEATSADNARALAMLEQEIGELTREVSRMQAETPPVEGPDPHLREVLLDRLHDLEAERSWLGEEIAQREERVRRIGAEVAQIRGLLEMHTPGWASEAMGSLAPREAPDRTPAWRQGVLEILQGASHPLHYREIAELLAATGRSLGGQDPAETLLAALGRDQDFVRVGRGTYWLRSRVGDASNADRRLRELRRSQKSDEARG